ncbi:hypothetical protein [Embleya sp. NPDC005971]|uniref:hypothetical protein n=1 Tax=Embleya sp. NPDC005971 TaxID=3156724 RepID=UPI0033DAB41B
MNDDSIEITPTEAAHVVWYFAPPGRRPGAFTAQLIQLIDMAGHENGRRLALAFPGYSEAVRIAKNDPRGVRRLNRIAFGRDAEQGRSDDGTEHPPVDDLGAALETAALVVDDEIERLRRQNRATIEARLVAARTNYELARAEFLAGGDA